MSLNDYQQIFDQVFQQYFRRPFQPLGVEILDNFINDVRNLGYQTCLTLDDDLFLEGYQWSNDFERGGAVNFLDRLRSAIRDKWNHWIVSYSSSTVYNDLMQRGFFHTWMIQDITDNLPQYPGLGDLWGNFCNADLILDNAEEKTNLERNNPSTMSFLEGLCHPIFDAVLGELDGLHLFFDNIRHDQSGITDIGVCSVPREHYHPQYLFLDIEAKKQFNYTGRERILKNMDGSKDSWDLHADSSGQYGNAKRGLREILYRAGLKFSELCVPSIYYGVITDGRCFIFVKFNGVTGSVYVSIPFVLDTTENGRLCFDILVRLFYLSGQLFMAAMAEPKSIQRHDPKRKHLGHNITLLNSEGEPLEVCLLSKIADTKSGAIYEAYDYSLKQIICLKMENGGLDQVDNEREILSLLSDCPGVPQYLYNGTYENYQCIATFPVGVSLDEIMRNQVLTITEAIEIGEALILVLKFIHERGIIHSDISPKNIIMHNGGLRLIDFGASYRKGEEWPGRGTREFLPTSALISGFYMDEQGDLESAYYVVNFLIDRYLPWMTGTGNDLSARFQFSPSEESWPYLQEVFPEFTKKREKQTFPEISEHTFSTSHGLLSSQ